MVAASRLRSRTVHVAPDDGDARLRIMDAPWNNAGAGGFEASSHFKYAPVGRGGTSMSRNTVYSALIVAIVALLISIWAIWTASDLQERVNAIEPRLIAVEGAPTYDPAVVEDLRDAIVQLEARIDEVEQTAAAPAPAPATPEEPPEPEPTFEPVPVQPQ